MSRAAPVAERIWHHLERPVEARAIGVGRIVLGLAALLKAWDIRDALADLTAQGALHIPYAEALPGPDPGFVWPLLALWAVAAVVLAAGVVPRTAGALLAVAIAGIFFSDQQVYSNHLYLLLVTVVLYTIARSGAAVAPGAGAGGVLPRWQVDLLRAQLTIVYGFAALAKLNAEYLRGEVLDVYLRHLGPWELPAALSEPRVLVGVAVASVAVEAVLAVAPWWRRARVPALALAVVFHVSIVATMSARVALTVFGLVMGALFAAFFADPAED